MKKHRSDSSTRILIGVGILLLIAACGYYLALQYEMTNSTTQGVMDSSHASGKTVVQGSTEPDYVPVAANTKGWKTYSYKKFGFQFNYPANSVVDVTSQQVNNLVLNVDDQVVITVKTKAANFSSLENIVKAQVELSKKDAEGAAMPVGVIYSQKTIGHVHGFLITRTAADPLRNTDATFEAEMGNYIVDFNYSYQAYILDAHPGDVLGGASETEDFKTKLAADVATYNNYLGMISTIGQIK